MSSIGYYALYFNSGFNFADDGNYAQICYELLLGRDPNDLAIGYGILWFKVGEFLFRIFGVNYTLIKLLFFFCITVTNVLIFYTVAIATGSPNVRFSCGGSAGFGARLSRNVLLCAVRHA